VLSCPDVDSDGSASASDAARCRKLNPAVFIVCRDVGCAIVLLLAGRIQAGKWLWPTEVD
jgi:hypothetical protein